MLRASASGLLTVLVLWFYPSNSFIYSLPSALTLFAADAVTTPGAIPVSPLASETGETYVEARVSPDSRNWFRF